MICSVSDPFIPSLCTPASRDFILVGSRILHSCLLLWLFILGITGGAKAAQWQDVTQVPWALQRLVTKVSLVCQAEQLGVA